VGALFFWSYAVAGHEVVLDVLQFPRNLHRPVLTFAEAAGASHWPCAELQANCMEENRKETMVVSICQQEAPGSIEDQCPMLVPGGVRCSHKATVIPESWALPPFCVPGRALCAHCYEELRSKALGLPAQERH
jgi:hypothetical protein